MSIMGANKEDVVYSFFDICTAVGAGGRVGLFDMVEDIVEGDVAGMELE